MSDEDSNAVWIAKIVIGVLILVGIAAVIRHQLWLEFGPVDGELISMITIPIGAVGIGMAIMLLTGEV